jgi:DUF3027 family protein
VRDLGEHGRLQHGHRARRRAGRRLRHRRGATAEQDRGGRGEHRPPDECAAVGHGGQDGTIARVSAPAVVNPPQRLVDAVALARAAAEEEAAHELDAAAAAAAVGEHLDAVAESGGELGDAVTHHFAAERGGYRGWRWSVTLAGTGDGPITVCEVVLQPGPDALVAPAWVPWEERVRPGDLGVGDLLPTAPDDARLVPAYLASDDPAVEEVATEVGLGRVRVMSRYGRTDAADRWWGGERGPGADMAKAAPAHCGTCAFYLPLAGSLRAAFGACGNRYSPADGSVVAAGYGCGAHSDVVAEQTSPVAVAELVYDDGVDMEPAGS